MSCCRAATVTGRTSDFQLQNKRLAQEEEVEDVKRSYEAAKEVIAELQQQLQSTQQDLTDALVSISEAPLSFSLSPRIDRPARYARRNRVALCSRRRRSSRRLTTRHWHK